MVVVFNHMIIIHNSWSFYTKSMLVTWIIEYAMNKFRIINMNWDIILILITILITKYIYYLDNIYKCNELMIL